MISRNVSSALSGSLGAGEGERLNILDKSDEVCELMSVPFETKSEERGHTLRIGVDGAVRGVVDEYERTEAVSLDMSIVLEGFEVCEGAVGSLEAECEGAEVA